ncbi:hypothetical protein ACE6H2_010473 [Prunus campanulata]
MRLWVQCCYCEMLSRAHTEVAFECLAYSEHKNVEHGTWILGVCGTCPTDGRCSTLRTFEDETAQG